MKHLAIALLILLCINYSFRLNAQVAECPYPIIMLHGWTGDQTSFIDTYTDNNFKDVFGTMNESQVFYSMNNASFSTNIWGYDGIKGTNDDDVLVSFINENNVLPAACVYAINQDNAVDFNSSGVPILLKNDGSAIGFFESDSNESALYKQGHTLGNMIAQVLAANPTKDKVLLIGHSMGGLAIREYLQRTEGGSHKWWVNPSASDGHQVIKAMTIVTPHRGSNTLGNIFGVRGENNDRDGLPDLSSEAIHDMRYNLSCFGTCTGSYLFSGNENVGWGWRNYDVNCDGDENNDQITGINIDGEDQGFSDPWDGTSDNPAMPLPDNLRYTYLTSNWFGILGDDGVVELSRQWIYNGSTPAPSDGTPYRLTDTLLTDVFHTSANDDADVVVRSIDEGDYPAHVWDIDVAIDYINLSNYRSANAPDGGASVDPDWFRFDIPAGYTGDVQIDFSPNSGIATRVDFFGTAPADYTGSSTTAAKNMTVPLGSSADASLTVLNADLNIGGENYFRFYHTNVDFNDWREALVFSVNLITILPVDWTAIDAKLIDKSNSQVSWSTEKEENLSHFEVEFSLNGVHFSTIGTQKPLARRNYSFPHQNIPFGKLFYRIKSVDYDGLISYSSIVDLNNNPENWTVQNIYPLPAQNFTEINIYSPENASLQFSIFNSQGQLLAQNKQELITGENFVKVDLSNLPSGIYMLLTEGQQQQIWHKIAKR